MLSTYALPNVKFFGIGLPRTATSSLAFALLELGFRTGHCYFNDSLLERGDAFFDTPVYADYPELDLKYPGSKFILSWRDPEQWLASFSIGLRNYLNDIRNPEYRATDAPLNEVNWRCYQKVFGTPEVYTDQILLDRYCRHRNEAEEYFRWRPHDLLIMDMNAIDDPWHVLCAFLDVPRPTSPFPRLNVQYVREWDDLVHPNKVPSWP